MAFVNLPHRVAAQQHAVKRLFQRHGVALTTAEYRELSAMCADGRATPLAKVRSGNTIHRVALRGREVWVIFDGDLGAIVTFLPATPKEIQLGPAAAQ